MKKDVLSFSIASVFSFSLAYAWSDKGRELDAAPVHPPVVSSSALQQHHGHEHGGEFVSPGKPAAAIVLASEGVQTLDLYSRKKLDLQLQNHAREGTVYIRLQPQRGLQLLSKRSEWEFSVNGSSTLTLPVEVMAQVEGSHLLHLFIEHQNMDGEVTPRALAIQFNAGLATDTVMYAKQNQEPVQHPQVIPLQAEEDIY